MSSSFLFVFFVFFRRFLSSEEEEEEDEYEEDEDPPVSSLSEDDEEDSEEEDSSSRRRFLFAIFVRCALSAVLLVSLSRLVVSLFERTCFDAQSGEREIAFYAGVLCGLCA